MEGRLDVFREAVQLFVVHRPDTADVRHDRSLMTDGFDDISCACFALGANEGRAFRDASQRFAKVFRAADERDLERVLVYVMFLVRRRQHFGFIDIVDADGLEDLYETQRKLRVSTGHAGFSHGGKSINEERTCASTKCPILTFAITGIETASTIALIIFGSLCSHSIQVSV